MSERPVVPLEPRLAHWTGPRQELHEAFDLLFPDDVRPRGPTDRWWGVRHPLLGTLAFAHAVEDADGLYIGFVGVMPKHRRQGYGARLVAAACRHGQRRGRPRAFCFTSAANVPAGALLRSLDFSVTKTWEDDGAMFCRWEIEL